MNGDELYFSVYQDITSSLLGLYKMGNEIIYLVYWF